MRGSRSTSSTRRATRISAQWDFSEDTYRTLTAVDSAVMVLDAAKGIEEQTRKLFEVCRLRDVPIITFAACHLTCVHKGVFHKHGEILMDILVDRVLPIETKNGF